MITISWSLTNYLAMKISNLFVSIVLFSVQSKLFYYFDRHDVMLTVANFCTKISFFTIMDKNVISLPSNLRVLYTAVWQPQPYHLICAFMADILVLHDCTFAKKPSWVLGGFVTQKLYVLPFEALLSRYNNLPFICSFVSISCE